MLDHKSVKCCLLDTARFLVFLNKVYHRHTYNICDGTSSITAHADVLVTPLRPAERLRDLNAAERMDLFNVVRRVQAVIEREFDATDSTINIQVYADATAVIMWYTYIHTHTHTQHPYTPVDRDAVVDPL